MRRTSFTIFCLIFFTSLSCVVEIASLNVECWYGEASYWKTFDKPFACVSYDIKARENFKEIVTSVNGTINDGKTNDDVIVLDLRGFFNIIPIGFDNFFKNLLGFSVYKSDLLTISSADLKPYPKLRELWIYSNALEYLPSNLLEHNPELLYIHFHSNQIKFIGSEFFSTVPKLYGASFLGNVCINIQAGNVKKLESLKKDIKIKCSSNAALDENSRKINKLKTDLLLFEISQLENEIMELENKDKDQCSN